MVIEVTGLSIWKTFFHFSPYCSLGFEDTSLVNTQIQIATGMEMMSPWSALIHEVGFLCMISISTVKRTRDARCLNQRSEVKRSMVRTRVHWEYIPTIFLEFFCEGGAPSQSLAVLFRSFIGETSPKSESSTRCSLVLSPDLPAERRFGYKESRP